MGSHLNKIQIIHFPAGLAIAAVYCYWAFESRSGATGIALVDFQAGFWLIGAIVVGYWWWIRRRGLSVSIATVLLWAAVFRIIGIWGEPMLEDDHYRFLLDGCMFVSSGSPYGVAPSSLFFENSLSPACEATLSGVNNPDLPTIYAPLLQYAFALAHIVSPADINVLQMLFALIDLALIIVLCQCAPARNVLLYAWSPLVLKEIAFTAHPDIVGVFLLFAAFQVRQQKHPVTACILVAMACCAKVFAVLALPFILWKQPIRNCLITAAVPLALYAPFIVQGGSDLPVLRIFAEQWQFNAFVFDLANNLTSDKSARIVCAALFLAWYACYFARYARRGDMTKIPRMDWVFGMLLVLSPVVNAWYLVWILPFAVVYPSCWAWTASLVLSLSYAIGLNLEGSEFKAYEVATPASAVQIIAISAALIIDYRRWSLKRHQ